MSHADRRMAERPYGYGSCRHDPAQRMLGRGGITADLISVGRAWPLGVPFAVRDGLSGPAAATLPGHHGPVAAQVKSCGAVA